MCSHNLQWTILWNKAPTTYVACFATWVFHWWACILPASFDLAHNLVLSPPFFMLFSTVATSPSCSCLNCHLLVFVHLIDYICPSSYCRSYSTAFVLRLLAAISNIKFIRLALAPAFKYLSSVFFSTKYFCLKTCLDLLLWAALICNKLIWCIYPLPCHLILPLSDFNNLHLKVTYICALATTAMYVVRIARFTPCGGNQPMYAIQCATHYWFT